MENDGRLKEHQTDLDLVNREPSKISPNSTKSKSPITSSIMDDMQLKTLQNSTSNFDKQALDAKNKKELLAESEHSKVNFIERPVRAWIRFADTKTKELFIVSFVDVSKSDPANKPKSSPVEKSTKALFEKHNSRDLDFAELHDFVGPNTNHDRETQASLKVQNNLKSVRCVENKSERAFLTRIAKLKISLLRSLKSVPVSSTSKLAGFLITVSFILFFAQLVLKARFVSEIRQHKEAVENTAILKRSISLLSSFATRFGIMQKQNYLCFDRASTLKLVR